MIPSLLIIEHILPGCPCTARRAVVLWRRVERTRNNSLLTWPNSRTWAVGGQWYCWYWRLCNGTDGIRWNGSAEREVAGKQQLLLLQPICKLFPAAATLPSLVSLWSLLPQPSIQGEGLNAAASLISVSWSGKACAGRHRTKSLPKHSFALFSRVGYKDL